MTTDADDALSWEGDDDHPDRKRERKLVQPEGKPTAEPSLPAGWKAVGKDSERVQIVDESGEGATSANDPKPLSTPMLLLVGILGGVYLLYTVGWIVGGLRLQASALYLVPELMYQVGVWAAVLAPALWFAAVWLLTRRSATWARVLGLLAGAALLIPWPFVMTGVIGA